MKKIFLFACLLLLFNACKKEKEELLTAPSSSDYSTIQANQFDDTALAWVVPTVDQLNHVWTNMMDSTDYVGGLNFIYFHGVFNGMRRESSSQ